MCNHVTEEQELFIQCKKKLNQTKLLFDDGKLIEAEYIEYCNQIYEAAYECMKAFATSVLLNDCLYKINKQKDQMLIDGLHRCYEIIKNELDIFDPIRSTPEEFFYNKFKKGGYDALGLRRPGNLNLYFKENIEKIKDIINDLSIDDKELNFKIVMEKVDDNKQLVIEISEAKNQE